MSGFIITLISVFLILDLLWWAYALRQFGQNTLQHRRRRLLVNFISLASILALLSIVLSRVADIPLDSFTPRIFVIFTLIWHLLALPVALIILLMHGTTRVGEVLFNFFRRPKPTAVSESSENQIEMAPARTSRREFLTQIGAFTPALITGGATVYSASTLSSLRVRNLQIPIAALPSALDGLTIAHVTDTHLGRFTDAAAFREIVSTINNLDADLVLHTGDLINDDQRLLPIASQMLREIKSRHGLFICEGNHDHIGGRENFRSYMRREGLPLLVDEVSGVNVNGQLVEVLGLSWTRARGTGMDDVIAQSVSRVNALRSSAALPILLAHHPHAFDAAVESRIPLTLGGHTHGGQMNLTHTLGFGAAMYRYWSGLYSRDGCHTVISNGAGNWFPLRINAPAEIVRITLARAT